MVKNKEDKMIARVKDYSATVAIPSIAEEDRTATYTPLIERLVFNDSDVRHITQQLRLILKAGVRPLCVIFEPERTTVLKHDSVVFST